MSLAHAALITDALIPRVAQRFKALGDPTRLPTLRLLVTHGELNVGQVVDALGMSQANVPSTCATSSTRGW